MLQRVSTWPLGMLDNQPLERISIGIGDLRGDRTRYVARGCEAIERRSARAPRDRFPARNISTRSARRARAGEQCHLGQSLSCDVTHAHQ
jgi:hypothetical protein